MLRKIIIYLVVSIAIFTTAYFSFIYYATYSEGVRSGELIKISNKGMLFKTWEGEISQGISGAQIFKFSILDKDEKVIEQLKEYQGKYVKVTYVERYRTFPWWGDTNYFVTEVQQDQSPFKMK
jgi:uncharacterized protein YwgA